MASKSPIKNQGQKHYIVFSRTGSGSTVSKVKNGTGGIRVKRSIQQRKIVKRSKERGKNPGARGNIKKEQGAQNGKGARKKVKKEQWAKD